MNTYVFKHTNDHASINIIAEDIISAKKKLMGLVVYEREWHLSHHFITVE